MPHAPKTKHPHRTVRPPGTTGSHRRPAGSAHAAGPGGTAGSRSSCSARSGSCAAGSGPCAAGSGTVYSARSGPCAAGSGTAYASGSGPCAAGTSSTHSANITQTGTAGSGSPARSAAHASAGSASAMSGHIHYLLLKNCNPLEVALTVLKRGDIPPQAHERQAAHARSSPWRRNTPRVHTPCSRSRLKAQGAAHISLPARKRRLRPLRAL